MMCSKEYDPNIFYINFVLFHLLHPSLEITKSFIDGESDFFFLYP